MQDSASFVFRRHPDCLDGTDIQHENQILSKYAHVRIFNEF